MDELPTKPDYVLEEWKEARSSIARFDQYLLDLRKYGFTLATILIGATAYLSTEGGISSWVRAIAAIAVMILIFALFLLDVRVKILLDIVLTRAVELEKSLWVQLKLSTQRKIAYKKVWNVKHTGLATYIFFMAAAGAVGSMSVITKDIESASWVLHKLLPSLLVAVWCLGSCVIIPFWDKWVRSSLNPYNLLTTRIPAKLKGRGGTTNDQGANRNIQR